MDRYRLKNIIILILVLVNVSLLSALVYRKSSEYAMLRRTEDELIALFAASDITLERSAISWETPLAALSMARDSQRERAFAQALLGSDCQETVQGGVTTFQSSLGTMQIRSGGGFDAALARGIDPDRCAALCQEFSYDDPAFSLNDSGTGTAQAPYLYNSRQVYNAQLTFAFTNGLATTLSGTLLPAAGVETPLTNPLSCAAALTAFQQMRRTEGTVGSSISHTYLCYEVQSSPSAAISLGSAWCIVTDIAVYYVNSTSGSITIG